MKVYMDNNATTPIRKEVLEEMLPFLQQNFGNPSSAHSFGKHVKEAIEEARDCFANAIGATPREIIFTSGGTEADNLAIKGIAFSNNKQKRNKIVSSAIEHPAVKETLEFLKKNGFTIETLPVDKNGIINLNAAEKIIDDSTLLISVMLANNEIGTIQPLSEIVKMAKSKGALVHSDMVQALGKIPIDVKELGVDLASFSSHKIYGPKGTGAIYIKKGVSIAPIINGGHQERRVRPGTENPAGIIGFAKAAYMATSKEELSVQTEHIANLRNLLEEKIIEMIPHSILNGDKQKRVPNTLNISFAFVEGEALSLMLDAKGIAVSTGSACSSGTLEPSHVLLAIGLPHEIAHGSIRFSLGIDTTTEEVEYVASSVAEVVGKLRSFSPLYEDFVSSKMTLDEYIRRSKMEALNE